MAAESEGKRCPDSKAAAGRMPFENQNTPTTKSTQGRALRNMEMTRVTALLYY
jgi:hypothetical protein